MCSVQGGVQLLRATARLITTPLSILNPFTAESDSSDSEENKLPRANTAFPQTLWFDAPPNAVPGALHVVQGPHGPLQVPLPDDMIPGKPSCIRLGPPESYSVIVPEGCQAGQKVSFPSATGDRLFAAVPPGLKAGDEFRITPPIILVQVPAGAEGALVSYCSPATGQVLTIRVPPAIAAGQYFPAVYPTQTGRRNGRLQYQEVEEEFVAVLDKAGNKELGLTLYDRGRGLIIDAVTGGAAQEWNDSQSAARQIQGGDRVSKVNIIVDSGEDDNMCLKVGVVVCINGLQKDTRLNGQVGTLSRYDEESGRWVVTLANGKLGTFAPEKLSKASEEDCAPLRIGDPVRIHGCKQPNDLHLNNKLGKLESFDKKSGKWAVKLSKSGTFKLLPERLSKEHAKQDPSEMRALCQTQSKIEMQIQRVSLNMSEFVCHNVNHKVEPTPSAMSMVSTSGLKDMEDLKGKRVSELNQLMVGLGATQEDIDKALDAGSPKQACIDFIEQSSTCTEDFSRKPLSELRNLMQEHGASDEELDRALDASDQRQACIQFIMAKRREPGNRSALEGEKNSELRKKAAVAGATDAEIDAAINSDNVKSKLIDLILSK